MGGNGGESVEMVGNVGNGLEWVEIVGNSGELWGMDDNGGEW